jgi:hypothetical protein
MERKEWRRYKINKDNFAATLIRFNQNLNYEKIYVFRYKCKIRVLYAQIFLKVFLMKLCYLSLVNMWKMCKILKKEYNICLKTRENESFLSKRMVAK